MSNREPTTKITYRWIAPPPATWKTYVFYRGIAFDLAPYLDRQFNDVMNMASQVWGISLNSRTPQFYRLYRAINRLRILRDGKTTLTLGEARLFETGVTA